MKDTTNINEMLAGCARPGCELRSTVGEKMQRAGIFKELSIYPDSLIFSLEVPWKFPDSLILRLRAEKMWTKIVLRESPSTAQSRIMAT